MRGPKVHPSGPDTGPHKHSESPSFLYKFQVAQPLPVLSLRATPSSHWLSRSANIRLLQWLKQNYSFVNNLQRLGSVLVLIVVAAPREIGLLLAVPSLLCSMLGICCTFATMSTDVMKILSRQYEFWFFSVMNIASWSLLAFFLHDLRALSLLPACLAVELGILMDANFRTFVSAAKSTYYLEIPTLTAIGAAVFLQIADIDRYRLELAPFARVNIALVDVFANTLANVLVFAMRRCYNRRHLLQRGNAGCKIVKCMLLRSKLVLRERVDSPSSISSKKSRDSKTRGLIKLLGASSSKLAMFSNNKQQIHHQQQISLVTLRLSTIDTRRTLLHSWPMSSTKLSTLSLVVLYACGLHGLVLCVASIGLAPPEDKVAPIGPATQHIPLVALVLSATFCGVFACGCQHDLLRSLLKNFAFLFPSIQFIVVCLCLADMMRWDYRCYAILAVCLWFHWVLLLDALTPPVKQRLLFKKRVATPVIFSIWLSIAAAMYAVVVLDASKSKLQDRDLFRWHLGGHRTIAWNTRTLFLSRIATTLVWTFRLFYDIVCTQNDELLFVRGTLDYYCPFDTFPGAPRKSIAAVPKATGVVRPRRSSRRASYADSMLISYSSVSKRHSSRGVFCMLGRTQSSTTINNLPRKKSVVSVVPPSPSTPGAASPRLTRTLTNQEACFLDHLDVAERRVRSAVHIRRFSVAVAGSSQLRDATFVLQ